METSVTEIATDIYRLSTFVSPPGLVFNQFLVVADESLLFHTGHRWLFPQVAAAAGKVMSVENLRWITFGHLEADECGSMNDWLAAAPGAQIAHGELGCNLSINDMADRPPRPLHNGDVIDLGGKQVRRIETPHVPHGWDAGLIYEETTGTLFCGDLFTALGNGPATTEHDIVGPAIATEDIFGATCLTPTTGATIRSLADLHPDRLCLMHGPSFTGHADDALRDLARSYDQRLEAHGVHLSTPQIPHID